MIGRNLLSCLHRGESRCLTEPVPNMRHGLLCAAVSVALVFEGCGSDSNGVITGTVQRCTVHAGSVTISVYRGTTAVATQSVRAGSTYHFSLPPGRYRVSTGHSLQDAYPAVTLGAGSTVHMNIPPHLCL